MPLQPFRKNVPTDLRLSIYLYDCQRVLERDVMPYCGQACHCESGLSHESVCFLEVQFGKWKKEDITIPARNSEYVWTSSGQQVASVFQSAAVSHGLS